MLVDRKQRETAENIRSESTFDESSNRNLRRSCGTDKKVCGVNVERRVGLNNFRLSRALFCRQSKCIVSCAEDKVVKIWDRSTGQDVQQIEFAINPSSIEISRDGSILTVANGANVSFFEMDTLKKIKEITVPTAGKLAAASLHPDKNFIVCGGEDFKIYKFDYITGNEIESFKGHFGPVHTISFSPDGELYASGSEDGTLRLWVSQSITNLTLEKAVLENLMLIAHY